MSQGPNRKTEYRVLLSWENWLQGTSVRDRTRKLDTDYFVMGKLVKVTSVRDRNENWIQCTSIRNRNGELITGTSVRDRTGKLHSEYFCRGKIGYTVLLSGTEPRNWLQVTSVGDRTGTLITGYFS